jgi:hypothetical protein
LNRVAISLHPDLAGEQQHRQDIARLLALTGDSGIDHDRAITPMGSRDHPPGIDHASGRLGKARYNREKRTGTGDLACEKCLFLIFG